MLSFPTINPPANTKNLISSLSTQIFPRFHFSVLTVFIIHVRSKRNQLHFPSGFKKLSTDLWYLLYRLLYLLVVLKNTVPIHYMSMMVLWTYMDSVPTVTPGGELLVLYYTRQNLMMSQ